MRYRCNRQVGAEADGRLEQRTRKGVDLGNLKPKALPLPFHTPTSHPEVSWLETNCHGGKRIVSTPILSLPHWLLVSLSLSAFFSLVPLSPPPLPLLSAVLIHSTSDHSRAPYVSSPSFIAYLQSPTPSSLLRPHSIKRLIGRQFSDKTVQHDKKLLPYSIVSKEGKPFVEVQYMGGKKVFSPEEVRVPKRVSSGRILRILLLYRHGRLSRARAHAFVSLPVQP
jgi:hypothetical protein